MFLTSSKPIAPPVFNPFRGFAVWLLALDLVVSYSRFFDMIASGYHIPGALYILLIIATVLSGSLPSLFTSPVAGCLLALTFWVAVSVALGIWRTGSIPYFLSFINSVLLFLAVAGLPVTFRHCRRVFYALACSSLVGALLSYVFGAYQSGRMSIDVGNFSDPNEYAMILLMGIPFWWLMASSSENPLKKILALVCTIPILVTFLKTGSRGGMIGLVAVLLALFWSASIPKKFLIVTVTLMALVISAIYLPSYLQQRYVTFLARNSNAEIDQTRRELEGVDVSSAEGRQKLLIKSLEVTLHHPLFGVGPGNFPVAVFEDAKLKGEQYAWFVTHNTYTQLSSETGIPGAFLFLNMLFWSFKSVNEVLRLTAERGPHPRSDLWNAAMYLRLSLIAISICGFFLSIAYTGVFYVFAGLCISFHRSALAEMRSGRPVAVPAPRRRSPAPRLPSRVQPVGLAR
jgi:O-antigen ligase